MISLCCVNCFNDDVIKKVITSHQSFGRCHYCNGNRVASLELNILIDDLTSILEGLSIMFEE